MALMKWLRGGENSLVNQELHDGYIWFCSDSKCMYIDHQDELGNVTRSKLSADFADRLRYIQDGDIFELTPEDINIALNNKVDKTEVVSIKADIQANTNNIDTLRAELPNQINDALLNSQADWNENDETSPAYVKNRTHYECTEMVTIVPEQSLEFIADNPEYIYDVEDLVEGEAYTVFFNGIKYTCIAYIADGPNTPVIGNGALVGVDGGNSEPFLAVTIDREMLIFAEAGTHTISIKKSVEAIVTIDEKFIPDSIKIGRMGTAFGAEIFNDYTNNEASAVYAHAEGYKTTASGKYSHAEGYNAEASGSHSHAEGLNTAAMGNWSHAEGDSTTASGSTSHAEGVATTASGDYSHAEGAYTVASGLDSHAEGQGSVAAGRWSHAEGNHTTASVLGQHVQGEYNILDTEGSIYERGRYAHIVGNGTYEARSNAHTLDWDGNAWFAGDIYVGGTSQDDASRLVKFSEIPEGVAVDASLTQEEQAADAKATGDAISTVQANIDEMNNIDYDTYLKFDTNEIV